MYNLGNKFKNNSNNLVSKAGSVFKGSNYRISILTERLVRLEFDEGGLFNNYETAIVKNRLFEVPEFNKQEDENYITIETRYFVLKYRKNNSFKGGNVTCTSKDGRVWSYGNK